MRKIISQLDDLLTVPMAKQCREVQPMRPSRWGWTEASVWTERMLATLERGIKGGRWFSLMDKEHQRWPNAYFAERGLISLALAHAKAANLQQTTDWRAGCGKTACPVRREGRGSTPRSYPYRGAVSECAPVSLAGTLPWPGSILLVRVGPDTILFHAEV